MSLELHPDKNPSATALDDFATLKNAYDVLMDMDAREVYDRFGPEKLKQKVAVIDEYKVLVEVAIFYAAWGIMTWMLTLGKHNSNARQWVFTGVHAASIAATAWGWTPSPRREIRARHRRTRRRRLGAGGELRARRRRDVEAGGEIREHRRRDGRDRTPSPGDIT